MTKKTLRRTPAWAVVSANGKLARLSLDDPFPIFDRRSDAVKKCNYRNVIAYGHTVVRVAITVVKR